MLLVGDYTKSREVCQLFIIVLDILIQRSAYRGKSRCLFFAHILEAMVSKQGFPLIACSTLSISNF
jgi:hypothetical protein